jgi:hypothetical protein
MAMAWHDVYQDFYTLPKKEQLELFRAIKKDLFPEPKSVEVCPLNVMGDIVLANGIYVKIVGSHSTI